LRLTVNAKARVTVPIRPISIDSISTIFPASLNWGVIPVESPTVQKAENSSKAMRARPRCPSVMLKTKIPSSIEEAVNKKALRARFSNSAEIV